MHPDHPLHFFYVLIFEGWPLLVFIGGVSLAVIMLVFRLSCPGDIAAIEQLRVDVSRIQEAASHEVLGQVTKWNQTIAMYKRYRGLWWSRLFVPSAWDAVREITVPKL